MVELFDGFKWIYLSAFSRFMATAKPVQALCECSLFILVLYPLYIGSDPTKQDCIKMEAY
jgi:hypothetical protein